jgi:hypothetical protein
MFQTTPMNVLAIFLTPFSDSKFLPKISGSLNTGSLFFGNSPVKYPLKGVPPTT